VLSNTAQFFRHGSRLNDNTIKSTEMIYLLCYIIIQVDPLERESRKNYKKLIDACYSNYNNRYQQIIIVVKYLISMILLCRSYIAPFRVLLF